MNGIFKVVACGEMVWVKSDKNNNGQVAKRTLQLQAFGDKYEDQWVATLWGRDAQCQFYPGEHVLATLKGITREYNGQVYQDINVQAIDKLAVNA